MPTESGDKKIIGNFRKLIDEVSADGNYNPANAKLKTTALNTQYRITARVRPAICAILNNARCYWQIRYVEYRIARIAGLTPVLIFLWSEDS